METSRASTGELIAGAGGLALFLFLFLDWFGIANAWEAFDIADVLLAIIGLGVAALTVARVAGMQIAVPGAPGVAVALAGFAATMITLTFLLEGEERKIGIWLAFFASLAIEYGGWVATRGRPGAPPPPRTTTPGGAPPPAV